MEKIYCEKCKKITTHAVVKTSFLTKWRTLTLTDKKCGECGEITHSSKETLRKVGKDYWT